MDNPDIGLGISFGVVEKQVGLLLAGLLDKALPADILIVPSTPTKDNRSANSINDSLDTNPVYLLEKGLRNHNIAKESAREAEERAQAAIKKAEEVSRVVELYSKLLDTLKTSLEALPEPKQSHLPKTVHKSAPRTSSQSFPRKISFANTRASQFGRPPQMPRRTIKAREPSPKPEPRPVTVEEFEEVSTILRGKVKLEDVNHAYYVLFYAFVNEEMEKIKLTELVKRGVAVSGRTEKAKLQVLRQLRRIAISNDQQYISPADL